MPGAFQPDLRDPVIGPGVCQSTLVSNYRFCPVSRFRGTPAPRLRRRDSAFKPHPAYRALFVLVGEGAAPGQDSTGSLNTSETILDGASALGLILSGDRTLFAIVRLSLSITLAATLLAAAVGMPLGAAVALTRYRGRDASIVVLNGLMGLPPVVVGLMVYLMLSRSGPLGSLGLLFTPTAMVIAQALLIAPIIAALTRQVIEDLWAEYRDELTAMETSPWTRVTALLLDARFSLVTILLAGLGRAAAEVGAVMIVGGNIDGFTRVMTTTIALETSKGDLPLALGLGIVLMILIMAINGLAWGFRQWAERHAG
jgi:tungstate transport system permease protein